jgi:NAD+ kinase
MIEHVAVVAKRGLGAATPHLRAVLGWLAGRGITASVDPDTAALVGERNGFDVRPRAEIVSHVDLVVVLGGDGTLLGVAHLVASAGHDTPILGINFGRLGYLTEVTLEEMLPSLDSVVAGTAEFQRRSMLRAQTLRGGQAVTDDIVLNDVVITRAAISRLIYLTVFVDDSFVTNVKADGLIVATPTGSTAYNLAAGGPIVHPGVDAVVITPIAPHSLGNRPIMVPGGSRVTIRAAADPARDDVFVTLDGQIGFPFLPGDEVVVTRAARTLRLFATPNRGYYDTLRTKLHWGEN